MALGVVFGLIMSQTSFGSDLIKDWVKPFGDVFDIQCESKAKNLASAMLAEKYKVIPIGSVDF